MAVGPSAHRVSSGPEWNDRRKHEPVCLWAALQRCRVACCVRACVACVLCVLRDEEGEGYGGAERGRARNGHGGSEWADGRDGTGFSFRWMSLLLLAVVVVV